MKRGERVVTIVRRDAMDEAVAFRRSALVSDGKAVWS